MILIFVKAGLSYACSYLQILVYSNNLSVSIFLSSSNDCENSSTDDVDPIGRRMPKMVFVLPRAMGYEMQVGSLQCLHQMHW